MKKLYLGIIMLVAALGLVSCNLQAGDKISFTSLPQPVYTAGHDEAAFKASIKISVNGGAEMSLAQAEGLSNVVISGIELDEPGEHVLVVVYNNVSLTYKYQVVATEGTEVSTAAELKEALAAKAAIIEIKADIADTTRFEVIAPVTIYGNGHSVKVSGSQDSRAFNIQEQTAGTFAFYDLEVICESTQSGTRGISLYDNQNIKLVLDNVSIFNERYYALNIAGLNDNIEVVMKNGSTAGGYCAINWWASNSTLKVYDSELHGDNIHAYGNSNDFGVVVLNAQEGNDGSNNTCTFENVTLTATTTHGNTEYCVILQDFSDGGKLMANNEVSFNNCTFNQAEYEGELSPLYGFWVESSNTVYVDGEKVSK